jgi:hypothetical protein
MRLRVHPGKATVMHELVGKFQGRSGYNPSGPRDSTRYDQVNRDPGEFKILHITKTFKRSRFVIHFGGGRLEKSLL